LLSSVDQLPRYIDAGYRLIAIGSDGVHVATAARDIAEAFTQRLSG
jgi:2-keto-3-deoxy-L-rhamnonate aldolase RhmA